MHKLPHEGPPDDFGNLLADIEAEAKAEGTEAELGEMRREFSRAENWRWPERPIDESPTAPGQRPEPVRLAFRRFLAAGDPYRKEQQ